ncbi:hypothetical protein [Marinicrinis lubricantis]|uniref:Rad50/SbcC-type AAA domain-containing protein n=1 Tax=Marinicrinis lubricantis TaxID=2086470 RepID=A0ABW1INA3_9BACL
MLILSTEISGFKLHKTKQLFEFGKVNEITGGNGKGKTSIVTPASVFQAAPHFPFPAVCPAAGRTLLIINQHAKLPAKSVFIKLIISLTYQPA